MLIDLEFDTDACSDAGPDVDPDANSILDPDAY